MEKSIMHRIMYVEIKLKLGKDNLMPVDGLEFGGLLE